MSNKLYLQALREVGYHYVMKWEHLEHSGKSVSSQRNFLRNGERAIDIVVEMGKLLTCRNRWYGEQMCKLSSGREPLIEWTECVNSQPTGRQSKDA